MAPSAPTYARIRVIVARGFEISEDRLAPETDLVALTWELGDPERLEWAMEAIEHEFSMTRPRGARQLYIPKVLTLTSLSGTVESGAWPEEWLHEAE